MTIEQEIVKLREDLQSARKAMENARSQAVSIIELAEWGVGNERIGGNIVKEEFWKGELSAARQILAALNAELEKSK